MKNEDLLVQVKEKAKMWLEGNFDQETKDAVKNMLENDEAQLIESFYKDLEFGTGGLRGIMGVGTNRMNIYTVGMATQGLCNYLKKNYGENTEIKVAIAHDCRNNSPMFAKTVAQIFSANNIKAYLFESLRPTPELSFAIRHFGCKSGVVITASHNPKEYNGFKAYWEDGAQLIEPHDKNVVEEAATISVDEIKFEGNDALIEIIGKEFDEIYLNKIKELSLNPEIIKKHNDLKIVYTPIHGTGVELVPAVLRKFGFENVFNIPEQDVVSGDFPTVVSPNPEESAALNMALEKAKSIDADLILATDPDADRVGIAIKNDKGEFILVNGNQTAVLLTYYLVHQWNEKGKLHGKEYIVKTIVTSELMAEIAEKYKLEYFDTLTGFKFIADIIRKNEGRKTYIGGGEESYGYLVGDFVRDKDAISACAMIAETAAWAREQGKTMFDLMLDIFIEFGFYKEDMISITRKGKSGAEEIQKMMDDFRMKPPDSIAGSDVMLVHDYLQQKTFDQLSHLRYDIELPKSNVLQFITQDGTKVSIRPSGTEPKIKFYFSVKGDLLTRADFYKVDAELDKKIKHIVKELGL
ncbi:MAG: phospho-sugar mutase [Bacteroidales bacterium]|nr:phospho-sugar mutase [Bacteroidales bacterium]MCF8456606.1 phospho-sugar mutase [Bacteroidales bacterium]